MLDATKDDMAAAPRVNEDHAFTADEFDKKSQQVDTYLPAHPAKYVCNLASDNNVSQSRERQRGQAGTCARRCGGKLGVKLDEAANTSGGTRISTADSAV